MGSNTLLVLELNEGKEDSISHSKALDIIARATRQLDMMLDDLHQMPRLSKPRE